MELIAIETPDEQPKGRASLPVLDPAGMARHAPDAHWVLLSDDGDTVARCSLWWSQTPSLPGQRLGIIGHYAARDRRAAHKLLKHACEELGIHGCTLAVGPMDGNTWRHYRLITERGNEPIFFLEPDNPEDWPSHFLNGGFTALAHYFSAINADLTQFDPRMPELERRLKVRGIRIRALDPRRLDEDLKRIHAVSVVSFRNNFLYMAISESEFIEQYRAILPDVEPEIILIAEQAERPIGFIFAVPDLLQGRRGNEIGTVILKTVAVLPERTHAGLGSLLIARCQEIARNLGYHRAIHALMHEANNSRNISRHYAQPMRRYALFAKGLRAKYEP